MIKTALTVILCSSVLLACRKNDLTTPPNDPTQAINKFFTLPCAANPAVARIAQKLQTLHSRTGFVQELIKKDGYALWEKALINLPARSGRSTNTANNADTIIYIPLVLDNTDYVNAFIYAKLGDSIQLQLHRGREYASYGFGSLTDTAKNAEKLAVQLMLLNESSFGHRDFKLLDDRLLKNDNIAAGAFTRNRMVHIEPANTAQRSGFQTVQYQVCTSSQSLQCTSNHTCCPDGSCSGCQAACWHTNTVCETVSVLVYIDNGDWGLGDLGTGGGGSGGGGTIYTDSMPCNTTPLLDNGLLPCPLGNTTGWMPITDDLYDPYIADNVIIDTSITNNFPCVEKILDTLSNYGNLNQRAQVALSQIFNVNKRIHTTIKLDRSLVGTSTSAYTKRTGAVASDPTDTAKLNFSATIFVNPDLLQNGTKECIAATFVHEAMHAYIEYVFTLYNQRYIPEADSAYVKSKFPIFWGGINVNRPPSEIQQHNLMALNWVEQISTPLYAFTNNDITPAMKDSIYRSLGWGGLDETDIFKAKPDKCDIMAINIAARNKNQGTPFTIVGYPQCTNNYTITAESLKLKNLCD